MSERLTAKASSEDMFWLLEDAERLEDKHGQMAYIFDTAPDEVKAELLKDPAFADHIAHRDAQQSIIEARIRVNEDEGRFYIF